LAASVAEFIGTFLLAGVVLATSGQSIVVLFSLLAIVLVVAGVSGAHLNPALTIGALATRRISLVRAACYIVAQALGAMMAFVIMSGFVNAAPEVSQQAQAFGQSAAQLYTAMAVPSGKEWVILSAELLGTLLLAYAVASAMRSTDKLTTAFAYAGGMFVAVLVAGTGAAYVLGGQAGAIGAGIILNPALAGALQALKFELWPLMIYVVTPLVAGVLGFALNDLVQNESEEVTV
jgi:glycerol uptake facilitator-like aquaporin